MNPTTTKVSNPPSTTTPVETFSLETPTQLHTCPTDYTESSCQFNKAENEILKTQLENCKSLSSDCTPPTLTDSSSLNHNTNTHIYVWFGFFIGFFVGCLFVIFLNSATYKKIKNTCCRKKKTVEEREREMNNLEKKKETKKDNNKDKKKKEDKKEEEKKEKKNPTKMEKKQEDLSWEDKNNLKKELNQQNPPPRQKKNSSPTSINLIDLNAKEEQKVSLKKESPDKREKIMVDSVAIVIENV